MRVLNVGWMNTLFSGIVTQFSSKKGQEIFKWTAVFFDGHDCDILGICLLPNLYIEILTPSVIVLGAEDN